MTGTDRHSFNPRPFVRGDDLFCGVFCGWGISIHALLQGDKRCYLVNSRTAAVNPTAKACFCQSSHSCNRASRASSLTADVWASNCLCRASGSNKSGSRLHSPSYRASNSGFIFSAPLDFSLLVCYHRFSSVSALRWVVSAVFGRRGTYSLIFCLGTARQSNYGLLVTVLRPALCKSHPALQA